MSALDMQRWQTLTQQLKQIENGDTLSPDQLRAMLQDIRALEHALDQAQQSHGPGALLAALSSLRLRAVDALSRPARSGLRGLKRFLMLDVPASFHYARAAVLLSLALLAGFGVVGWLLVQYSPDLAGLFMDPQQMDEVRDGKVWTDEIFGLVPGSVLSFNIMLNNILVSLFAFGVGVIYGLGTLYILLVNGTMLGVLLAFTYQNGVGDRLLSFIPAHGCVELFVICLAAGCGLRVGHALIHPGLLTRTQAFRNAIARTTPALLFGCAGLVICGLIEGYVSPNPAVGMALRWGIGLVWLAIFLFFLIGVPWRKHADAERAHQRWLQGANV
jgi:uncharacterized membrane protein SpoIIM required for sporulation